MKKIVVLSSLILLGAANFSIADSDFISGGEYADIKSIDYEFESAEAEKHYWGVQAELLLKKIDAALIRYKELGNREKKEVLSYKTELTKALSEQTLNMEDELQKCKQNNVGNGSCPNADKINNIIIDIKKQISTLNSLSDNK